MDVGEVAKVVGSVWKMTERGDNHIGQHGVYMQSHEIDDLTSDAFRLLAFLRAHQGRSVTYFWIANGLAKTFDWTVKRLARARSLLIKHGLVRTRQKTVARTTCSLRLAKGKSRLVESV